MTDKLLDSWYALLNENVSIDGTVIPVHKITMPANTNTYFIRLRPESSSRQNTNVTRSKKIFLNIDIITDHDDQVNDRIVEEISDQIETLLFPYERSQSTALPAQSGIRIILVQFEGELYQLLQDSGVKKYRYIKSLRYSQLVTKEN